MFLGWDQKFDEILRGFQLILVIHIPDSWPMSGISLSVCEVLAFVG